MPRDRKLTDLTAYTFILPYASELFGIYQPLVGWKSERSERRFQQGFLNDKRQLLPKLMKRFVHPGDIHYDEDQVTIDPGLPSPDTVRLKRFGSVLLDKIADALPPYRDYRPAIWSEVISPERLNVVLKESVAPEYARRYAERYREIQGLAELPGIHDDGQVQPVQLRSVLEHEVRQESSIAGALLFLAQQKRFRALEEVFYSSRNTALEAGRLGKVLSAIDPVEGYLDLTNMNPRDQEHLRRVALSPISVVHLFRQYFFELDTFLGTPVGHVWLSPGATVELIEIQTRRTLVEKTMETALDIITKAESEETEQDELSDAVKDDNKQDIKAGASVTATYTGITASANFDYTTSQQMAREATHKRVRTQTERLSTEIRKHYKTTFKTISETTDTSSKRYVLSNTTKRLINYELRRKMRQVAVQVQDIGTYLCWQTYVDRPGEALGVAKLMHIAKPAELDGLHAPEEIPMLQPFTETKVVTLPFISVGDTDADNMDEVYVDGVEVDNSEIFGTQEKIQADFPIECICPKGNYELADVEVDSQGRPLAASRKGAITNQGNKASFELHLDSVDFQGQNSIQLKLTLHWTPGPGANDDAIAKNKANVAAFKAREAAEYQKAYVENVQARIKHVHAIRGRPGEELREEERIVVYRKLIQDMLANGIIMPDDRTRHVVTELLNSIFDVDKMLYFVAPEWWRPRLMQHRQQLNETDAASVDPVVDGGTTVTPKQTPLAPHTVGWGGIEDSNRDNYFITSDSEPARFGSSLGWLLQLDGDNMRNAFLNAPWVKAVIPVRPGKEVAAVNWLKGVEGMNGISDADYYQTDNPNERDSDGQPLNGQKMIDVILDLGRKIQRKHEEGVRSGKFPKESEVSDPELVDSANVVTSTPIDRVYEHGFFPLQGGFRANVQANYEVFDQWLEILPTDQVVPVEVAYNPKTGRQV